MSSPQHKVVGQVINPAIDTLPFILRWPSLDLHGENHLQPGEETADGRAHRIQHSLHRGLPLKVQRNPAEERDPEAPSLLLKGDRRASGLQ